MRGELQILTVKQKVQEAKGHAVETQKIIFAGKILNNGQTIEGCNIQEKDFLVSLVSKPKAPKPESKAPPQSETSQNTSNAQDPQDQSSNTDNKQPPAPRAPEVEISTTEQASSPAPTNAASTEPVESTGSNGRQAFVAGAVEQMVEMGFPRDQVDRAMQAAFNNPERAVEYLMNGIPEGRGQSATAPTTERTPTAQGPAQEPRNLFEAAAAQAAQANSSHGMGAFGGELNDEGDEILDLGDPAMLNQLQTLAEENPAALQPLVQALAQQSPHLATALQNNPAEVLRFLEGLQSGVLGEEGEQAESMDLPSFDALEPEDRTSIETIAAMGIPQELAIEAYFVCGKNVELAVSYCFDDADD